jgi:hypothetical protein
VSTDPKYEGTPVEDRAETIRRAEAENAVRDSAEPDLYAEQGGDPAADPSTRRGIVPRIGARFVTFGVAGLVAGALVGLLLVALGADPGGPVGTVVMLALAVGLVAAVLGIFPLLAREDGRIDRSAQRVARRRGRGDADARRGSDDVV